MDSEIRLRDRELESSTRVHGSSGTRAEATLTLSPAQERLAFIQRLDPDNAAFQSSIALTIRGELDAGRLGEALDRLASRHAPLRTAIVETNGGLSASVASRVEIELQLVDLSVLADAEQTVAVDRKLEQIASEPFDLSRRPLLRACLLRLQRESHVLALTFHQTVCDAASVDIFVRELFAAYRALTAGSDDAEPPTTLDYYSWARALRAGAGAARGAKLAALRKHLASAISPLQLPADRARPATFTYRGASIPWRLAPELASRVCTFAAERGTTPESVLLAAFGAVLHRYSGQEHFAIGVPLRARSASGSAGAIGLFENLGVVSADSAGTPSFQSYLERVHESLEIARAHEDVPFEELVDALNAPRDFGRTPLFQALFSYTKPAPFDAAAGLRVAKLEVPCRFTRTDLSLYVEDTGGAFAGFLEFSRDVYDSSSIEQLSASLAVVLDEALAAPEASIARLPLLDRAARQAELETWNATELPYERERTVVDRFEQHASESPEAAAIQFNGQELSYGELNVRANRLAHELTARGARPGVGVAIALDRSLELVVSVLAVLKTGSHYVPLDPRHPEARNARILELAEPAVIVTERKIEAMFNESTRDRRLVLEEAAAAVSARSDANPERRAVESGVAYILFTSGSTGDPKGVEVSHGALTNFVVSMAHTPGITRADRVLALTTISFDIAGLELYLPLTHGACIELVDTETAGNPKLLVERIAAARPSLVQATPATWQMLLDVGWAGDRSLRALCGGEAMSLKLAHELSSRVGELWNMYGPTETTIWSAVFRVPNDATSIPIGLPIHNTTIHVLDDALEPVPRGVVGEIFIGGDGVAEGYHKKPELTAEKFISDPFAPEGRRRLYRTGDLGRRRRDGQLEWLARRDFQVKIRGFRIELGEIEAALVAHPAVELAVAGVQNDASGDKRLVAHLLLEDRGTELPSGLREHLQERLPSYMVPSAMMALASFPLTPNGKVDRKQLPEVQTREEQEHVPPESDLELNLAKIWTKLLGVPEIGTKDDFFRLGGHSLMAVRMLHAVQQSCGVEVPLATFFAKPTISDLADAVQKGGGELRASILELSRQTDGRPFYFIAGIQLYQALADELGAECHCSGMILPIEEQLFKAEAASDLERGSYEVRDVARRYVELIRAHRPEGPYWIAGISFGGVLAYEVARQLRALGATVPLLVIIDSLLPGAAKVDPSSWVASRLRQLRSQGVRPLLQRARRKLLGTPLEAAALRDADAEDEELLRLRRIRAYDTATLAYERETHTRYPGRTLVVRAADAEGLEGYTVPSDLGWTRRVSGELLLATVKGDHLGILRPPYVRDLAQEIKRHLDPAARTVAASAGGFGALLVEAATELDTAFQLVLSTVA